MERILQKLILLLVIKSVSQLLLILETSTVLLFFLSLLFGHYRFSEFHFEILETFVW